MTARSRTAALPDAAVRTLALAGDWHGSTGWAIARIQGLAAKRGVDLILHLGDFGIWPGPGGKQYLQSVEAACAANGVHIWVTPGNHEDWARLTAQWANPKNRDGDGSLLPLALTEHIAVLPRGHRFSLNSPTGVERTFVSLGGAPSIDYPGRIEGRDWWPEEAITDEDVQRVAAGGYADVMLAHDAPDLPYATDRVQNILSSNWGWSAGGLAYAAAGRRRMHEAFLAVKPRLFAHGHYHASGAAVVHLPDAAHPTRIWSLDCDGSAGNVRLLDLDTLDDHPPIYNRG